MNNLDKIVMFMKVHLTDGSEKTHSIELDPRGGSQTIDFANKLSDGIRNMLDKGNTLILPSTPTIYNSDKVAWVEIGSVDRKDLMNLLEQQAKRKLGFRTT